MEPHSSTLAWKIPWTEEPGGLQSVGSLYAADSKAQLLEVIWAGVGTQRGGQFCTQTCEGPEDREISPEALTWPCSHKHSFLCIASSLRL